MAASLVLGAACRAPTAAGSGGGSVAPRAAPAPVAVAQPLDATVFPIRGLDPADCYHVAGSPAHAPSCGFANADDTYALDLNCIGQSELGKEVSPVRPGVVRQVNERYGWVLVEHPEPLDVHGVSFDEFYSGYMHMTDLAVAVDEEVTTATTLGKVGTAQTQSPHLHFVVYVGLWPGPAGSVNGGLMSIAASALGGPLARFE